MPIEIRRKDVKTLIAQDRAQIVEVLSPSEYKKEHLPKAVNMPLETVTPENTKQLRKDQAVIVYCANGNRSAFAADVLGVMGYEHVRSLKEGFSGWVADGGEVE